MQPLSSDLLKQITPEVMEEAVRLVSERAVSKSQRYPVNSKGVPEYRSVVFTVDHIFTSRNTETIGIQKMAFSTEEAQEAALALFDYYGDKLSGFTLSTLLQWRENHLSDVLVYFVPQTVRDRSGESFFQIVCSQDLYSRIGRDMTKGKFSHLMIRETIFDAVEKMILQATVQKAPVPPLVSVAVYDDAAEEAEQPSGIE